MHRPARTLPLILAALVAISLSCAPSQAVAPEDKVFVTKSGERYHQEDCRTLKRSKTVTETTRKAAEARKLTACKVCKP